MSFLSNLFGGGTPPLGSAANPVPGASFGTTGPTPAAIAPVPPPPTAPTPTTQQAQAPSFAPMSTQSASQQANVNVAPPTFLGAAALAGQTAKTKATLG